MLLMVVGVSSSSPPLYGEGDPPGLRADTVGMAAREVRMEARYLQSPVQACRSSYYWYKIHVFISSPLPPHTKSTQT